MEAHPDSKARQEQLEKQLKEPKDKKLSKSEERRIAIQKEAKQKD